MFWKNWRCSFNKKKCPKLLFCSCMAQIVPSSSYSYCVILFSFPFLHSFDWIFDLLLLSHASYKCQETHRSSHMHVYYMLSPRNTVLILLWLRLFCNHFCVCGATNAVKCLVTNQTAFCTAGPIKKIEFETQFLWKQFLHALLIEFRKTLFVFAF